MSAPPEVLAYMTTPEGRAAIRDYHRKRTAESDLRAFLALAWEVIEPGKAYLHNWHIDLIAEYLMAVDAGQIKRLVVNIPPRHSKSTIITVAWPTWSWIHDPRTRWQFWSYSDELMTKHSLDRRAIIESDWYQRYWGDRVHLSPDQNRKQIFMNDERGVMDATRSKTGKGGNRIVIDDPLNPEDAFSEAERIKANRVYDQTLSSRLDNPEEDAVVCVMQRLHEDDLTGHLLELGFEHLALPSIADEPQRLVFPISGEVIERDEGHLLWPERFSRAVLDDYRTTLGEFGFAAQYQQRPVPLGGAIFHADRWRTYRAEELPERFRRVVAVADTAHKAGAQNDYTVAGLWGETRNAYYLLDLLRGRWEYPEMERALVARWQTWRNLPAGWRPSRFIVEDASSGTALIQRLSAETTIPVEPFKTGSRDKEARAHTASGYQASGKLLIPERPKDSVSGFDVGAFVSEHALFPNGKHDDQVDVTSIAMLWFSRQPDLDAGLGVVATGMTSSNW